MLRLGGFRVSGFISTIYTDNEVISESFWDVVVYETAGNSMMRAFGHDPAHSAY